MADIHNTHFSESKDLFILLMEVKQTIFAKSIIEVNLESNFNVRLERSQR